MAKSFELENKIENIKAHYSSGLSKLYDLNREIEETIKLKKAHQDELSSLSNEVTAKQTYLLGLRRELGSTQESLKRAEVLLEQASKDKSETIKEHEEIVRKLSESAKSIENKIKVLVKLSHSVAEEVNAQYLAKRAEAEHFEELLESLDKQVEEKNRFLTSARQEVKAAIAYKERIILEAEVIAKELAQKVSRLQVREEELKQISQDYTDRHKKLDVREADINVIARRIKRKYEELNPDKKIEL